MPGLRCCVGVSVAAVSGGCSSSSSAFFSFQWLRLLWSTGSRHRGSWRADSGVAVRGLRCPAACGIFLEEGSNPCPLHCQADSYPLYHQGSPTGWFFKTCFPLIKKVIDIVGVYVSKTHSLMSFYYRLSHMEPNMVK